MTIDDFDPDLDAIDNPVRNVRPKREWGDQTALNFASMRPIESRPVLYTLPGSPPSSGPDYPENYAHTIGQPFEESWLWDPSIGTANKWRVLRQPKWAGQPGVVSSGENAFQFGATYSPLATLNSLGGQSTAHGGLTANFSALNAVDHAFADYSVTITNPTTVNQPVTSLFRLTANAVMLQGSAFVSALDIGGAFTVAKALRHSEGYAPTGTSRWESLSWETRSFTWTAQPGDNIVTMRHYLAWRDIGLGTTINGAAIVYAPRVIHEWKAGA